MKPRFYTFSQNNSGGSFTGPAAYVIVEALSPDDANNRAESAGLYFDGCDDGRDCSCCGDRWYRQFRADNGDDKPSIYGTPVDKADDLDRGLRPDKLPQARVVFMNGKVKDYFPKRNQHDESRPRKQKKPR
jgi:hypothetical protein